MSEIVKTYYGNLDGRREGLIIAKSQKQAAEIAGCSVYSFRQFWSVGKFNSELKPYTLYTRPYKFVNKVEYVEGKCPL